MVMHMIVIIAVLKIALLASIQLSNKETPQKTAVIPKTQNHWYLHNTDSIKKGDNMYTPKPIDTSDVILPDELLALTEKIASNVHDVWAVGRISEGWVYGTEKDQSKKINPALVPYSELPESEKDYDRNTVLETIKLIVKMGYTISKTGS